MNRLTNFMPGNPSVQKPLAVLAILSIIFAFETAIAKTCTFSTNQAIYDITSPPEELKFSWDVSTKKITGFMWQHGPELWFPFVASPGSVEDEGAYARRDPPYEKEFVEVGRYTRFEIGITTRGVETVRFTIKGYVTSDAAYPSATFAGIYEGTRTTPFAAHGILRCR